MADKSVQAALYGAPDPRRWANNMWYGLTKENITRGLVIFTGLGVVAAVAGLIGGEISNSGPKNYWALLILFLAIPGIWIVLVAILTITWLKVDNQQVEWYLWKKVRLFGCPIEDITHIGGGSVSAFVIKTRKGTIRLFGLDIGNRKRLSKYLMEKNPNIQWL
jgi:hypothetical protein